MLLIDFFTGQIPAAGAQCRAPIQKFNQCSQSFQQTKVPDRAIERSFDFWRFFLVSEMDKTLQNYNKVETKRHLVAALSEDIRNITYILGFPIHTLEKPNCNLAVLCLIQTVYRVKDTPFAFIYHPKTVQIAVVLHIS